jgi:hypothetical protein
LDKIGLKAESIRKKYRIKLEILAGVGDAGKPKRDKAGK